MAEPLDPRLVYGRTAAGVSELSQLTGALPAAARRVLVLLDGRRPLAALPAAVRPGELPRLIEELLARGLIALSGIVEALPAGNPLREPGLEDFKRRIDGAVSRELGPAGRVLEARLQDCVNMTVMRGVMREIVELVRARAGDDAARRVADAAQAANRAWAGRVADAVVARPDAGSPPPATARPQSRDGPGA